MDPETAGALPAGCGPPLPQPEVAAVRVQVFLLPHTFSSPCRLTVGRRTSAHLFALLQVVVVAAGYDTRAYRLIQPGVTFFEVRGGSLDS